MNRSISSLQLSALLFCVYISSLLTMPEVSQENTVSVMLGSAVSTAVQLLLFVPVILFVKRSGGTDPCTFALEKSRTAGTVLTLAYLIYFLHRAFIIIGDFGYYTDYFIPPAVSRNITPVCLALAGAYLATQRLSVSGKTGTVIFACLLFAIAVIALSLIPKSEIPNLHFAVKDRVSSVMRCTLGGLSRCEAPVLMCFLLPAVKQGESYGRTAVKYTLLQLAAAAVILGFTGMALGGLVHFEKVPVFTAVSLADGGMIRRFDSFFLILWSMTAMVRLGLMVYCSAKCIGLAAENTDSFTACMVSAAVPLICAYPLLYSYEWEGTAYGRQSILPLIMLSAVIPLIMMTFSRKEKAHAKAKTRPQPAG